MLQIDYIDLPTSLVSVRWFDGRSSLEHPQSLYMCFFDEDFDGHSIDEEPLDADDGSRAQLVVILAKNSSCSVDAAKDDEQRAAKSVQLS